MSETTDFGFRAVPIADKARRVGEVFTSVAFRYDLMNDLMSGGVHRIWKAFAVALARPRCGERVLDIAGGTGDMTARVVDRVGPRGHVVLTDVNAAIARWICDVAPPYAVHTVVAHDAGTPPRVFDRDPPVSERPRD